MMLANVNDIFWPALATTLIYFEYLCFTINCGRARGKYGVKAPAVSGHLGWENLYRIQMNTLESMSVVVPMMWLAAHLHNYRYAGYAGLLYAFGRVLFALGYPNKRAFGFVLGLLAQLSLFYMVGCELFHMATDAANTPAAAAAAAAAAADL
eukprot:TRINITY_DN3512_c1_g1_i1.p3 TRINITY_DN3512_c1_g1~~TRINITY_DN3512_c1_g1_i1.p3  ORF type:complete len:160 (+),score=59.61 TRINITY_DN3512_c1_g1_i1:27-482(+)